VPREHRILIVVALALAQDTPGGENTPEDDDGGDNSGSNSSGSPGVGRSFAG
jgi:hypothetical protein